MYQEAMMVIASFLLRGERYEIQKEEDLCYCRV